jgi:hypothetical protein
MKDMKGMKGFWVLGTGLFSFLDCLDESVQFFAQFVGSGDQFFCFGLQFGVAILCVLKPFHSFVA